MKILIATKRQYTGKDLISDQYGRLFEIPEAIAEAGHEVTGLALSYRQAKECVEKPKSVEWRSVSAFPFSPHGIYRYLQVFRGLASTFRPDVVWASSDALHGIAAAHICRLEKIPLVIDLYDNYESFGLSKIPGIISNFRAACRRAAGLSVASSVLKDFVEANYRIGGAPVQIVGNAVNKSLFYPRRKEDARNTLGLPCDAQIIGTAGALSRSRGIEDLFAAFQILAGRHKNIFLAVAGPRDTTLKTCSHERMLDLGVLPLSAVPLLWSALDVGVICNKPSDFGQYCYPQKYQEILACGTPFVAARVGEMARICADDEASLYTPGSAISLARQIEKRLNGQAKQFASAVDWKDRAETLLDFFRDLRLPLPHICDEQAIQ